MRQRSAEVVISDKYNLGNGAEQVHELNDKNKAFKM
jgi:hypothetical protein